MPKLINYTPRWLSRPSPGFDLFSSNPDKNPTPPDAGQDGEAETSSDTDYRGPCRLLAHRGSEVFAVVDNSLRWADLAVVKYDWETQTSNDHDETDEARYRVRNGLESTEDVLANRLQSLKVPVHEKIRQIAISPNHDLLAIATSHNVHVAILPDSSWLGQPDTGPIKLKTHTIGPTIHILSQARIASLLWHPLGVNGACLVTVTVNAVVRLWELDRGNRGSFDTASFAVDLRKLHNAASAEDDISAEGYGYNKGFSLDGIGMEVSAATFGGLGLGNESGWSAMTLYIAMSEGDLYSMCPLLPSKWQPPATLIPALTATVSTRKAFLDSNSTKMPQKECQINEMHFQWLSELDQEEPMMIPSKRDLNPEVAVYSRPKNRGFVPILQGPFRVLPGDLQELELMDVVDVHVIAPKIDIDELIDDEEPFDVEGDQGLSMPVVNVLTSAGTVFVCLALEEVEAKWLPLKKSSLRGPPSADAQPELHVLGAFDTISHADSTKSQIDWAMFTHDPHSRYAFFTSHKRNIHFFSLDFLVDAINPELQEQSPKGAAFRLKVLLQEPQILRQRILRFEKPKGSSSNRSISAPVVLQDSDLGYFLLTASSDKPYAALFDTPTAALDSRSSSPLAIEFNNSQLPDSPDTSLAPRIAYQPPTELYDSASADIYGALDESAGGRRLTQSSRRSEVRLSAATLDGLARVHRRVSAATQRLGGAVAELFTRGHRLPLEFAAQRSRVGEVAERVEQLLGEDADDYDQPPDRGEDAAAAGSDRRGSGGVPERGPAKIEARLQRVATRQAELAQRQEELRRRLATVSAKPLADEEKAWAEEVEKLEAAISPPLEPDGEDGTASADGASEATAEDTSATERGDERPAKPGKGYWERLDEVSMPAVASLEIVREIDTLEQAKALARELLDQAQAAERAQSQQRDEPNERPASSRHGRSSSDVSSVAVPADVRKKRVGKVMELLYRESELVDAAQARLERLSIAPTAA